MCVRLFVNLGHALLKSRAVTSYDVWLPSTQSNSRDLSFRQSKISTYAWICASGVASLASHVSLPNAMESDRCSECVIGLIHFCLRYWKNKEFNGRVCPSQACVRKERLWDVWEGDCT